MTSKIPFVKQDTHWIAFIPQVIFICLFSLLFYQYERQFFLLYALMLYFVVKLLMRMLFFPGVLYNGIKLIKLEKLKEAIPEIEKTIDYYTTHAWVDKYRFLLMISSSERSIREVSVCNLAFCLLHTGEIDKAKELYETVLLEYPKNIIAKGALKTINLFANNQLEM